MRAFAIADASGLGNTVPIAWGRMVGAGQRRTDGGDERCQNRQMTSRNVWRRLFVPICTGARHSRVPDAAARMTGRSAQTARQ